VLVTGSAGFVGFHAAAALRRDGHGVVGLDNFNSYYSPQLKSARAAELERLGVHTVTADLNDADAVRRRAPNPPRTKALRLRRSCARSSRCATSRTCCTWRRRRACATL